ncbi:MAG TPA: hypothetical protein DEB39_11210 [Planctomycetaceae bacterium]|nr:hypothetical protein [Planctomycetaceae bacterium]
MLKVERFSFRYGTMPAIQEAGLVVSDEPTGCCFSSTAPCLPTERRKHALNMSSKRFTAFPSNYTEGC